MRTVIVSRHPAAVAFIARALGGTLDEEGSVVVPERLAGGGKRLARIPVLASATAEDVAGAMVYGNLPLSLAALAAEVVAVEFEGAPPRGAEYSIIDMDAAGARLVRYRVEAL